MKRFVKFRNSEQPEARINVAELNGYIPKTTKGESHQVQHILNLLTTSGHSIGITFKEKDDMTRAVECLDELGKDVEEIV